MNHMEEIKPDYGELSHQIEESKIRHQWISVAAYYKAQARGFSPGLELNDWLAAEKEYVEMRVTLYLSIAEEDGAMTIGSLRELANSIGVQNPERLDFKVVLIRAIQAKSQAHPCFQIDPGDVCHEIAGCQWKAECRKLIAQWKR